ncbi:MAG: hypothetical protein AAFZ15_32845 [Bacteroidota bacterium]
MKYTPISCDYYDELTLLALRHKTCPVVFKNENGTKETVEASIKDIFTRNSEEFLLLSDGREIRLDRLISVDGKILSNYC